MGKVCFCNGSKVPEGRCWSPKWWLGAAPGADSPGIIPVKNGGLVKNPNFNHVNLPEKRSSLFLVAPISWSSQGPPWGSGFSSHSQAVDVQGLQLTSTKLKHGITSLSNVSKQVSGLMVPGTSKMIPADFIFTTWYVKTLDYQALLVLLDTPISFGWSNLHFNGIHCHPLWLPLHPLRVLCALMAVVCLDPVEPFPPTIVPISSDLSRGRPTIFLEHLHFPR